MTDLSELTERVNAHARQFQCGHIEALVYAIESIVANELGDRVVPRNEVDEYVHDVCSLHNINSPKVVISPSSSRTIGSASVDEHLLCLARARSSVLTILHEIAHFLAPNDGHNDLFRNSYIRLVRNHVGIEHAALLFSLYGSLELRTAPWESLRH